MWFYLVEMRSPGWYADRGGHPRTDKVKSKIFHAFDLPRRFEIDLEFASVRTRPPGFVFRTRQKPLRGIAVGNMG